MSLRLRLSAEFSELFLLELLHSLLFERGFVFLGELVFGDYHLAVDGFADFLCGTIAIPIMGRKRKYLIVGHYADTLTLDFVQYELTALGKGLRWVCIADSKQIVALCIRGTSSVSDAYLGGVDVYRCSAVANRRDAVVRCQWLVHRHLTTASLRQHGSPLDLLPVAVSHAAIHK